MNYTSAVSIIPGGCPQFLDCRLDAKSLGRFWAYFREIPQTGESAIASARRQVELVPVPLDDTGQPGDYDYKIDANRALEAFTGRWVPVPFLRLSNEQWKDGAFKCEKGPSNWARLHVSREDSDGAYRLTFLFDTTIEEREQPTGQYFALCDDDVAENARFALSPKSRDNAWFLNTLWVDEWIAEIYDAHQTARHNGRTTWRENTPFIMEHLATYLTLLEALAASGTVPTVRVVDPAHLTPVDVDLVLDLGNSRSTGMLVETLPQRQTNLNDSYLLQIRDLSQPDRTYTGPFATRIEFAEATFGNPRLSARSGRSTPAFVWPSVVRVVPEAPSSADCMPQARVQSRIIMTPPAPSNGASTRGAQAPSWSRPSPGACSSSRSTAKARRCAASTIRASPRAPKSCAPSSPKWRSRPISPAARP